MATKAKKTPQKKPVKKVKAKKTRKKKIVKEEVVPVEGLYQEAIRISASWFRAGMSEQKVAELITTHYERFSPPNVQYVLHKASQQIAAQYSRDRKNVVALHLKRYNKDAQLAQDWFKDEEYESVPKKFRKEVMLGKLNGWIDILGAKERVLQMHMKETQVKIFNKLNVKVKEKKVMFDLSKLSLAEKVEFLTLIQKTKKTQTEILGITNSADVKKVVTEDIEHEVVEVPNITFIEQTNIPVIPRERVQAQNLGDLTNKLRATLLKKAEEEFKKAGAKKVAPTVKHEDE
jgi:hypothetical protein